MGICCANTNSNFIHTETESQKIGYHKEKKKRRKQFQGPKNVFANINPYQYGSNIDDPDADDISFKNQRTQSLSNSPVKNNNINVIYRVESAQQLKKQKKKYENHQNKPQSPISYNNQLENKKSQFSPQSKVHRSPKESLENRSIKSQISQRTQKSLQSKKKQLEALARNNNKSNTLLQARKDLQPQSILKRYLKYDNYYKNRTLYDNKSIDSYDGQGMRESKKKVTFKESRTMPQAQRIFDIQEVIQIS